jgi:transcriptional regulator with XRE-family HTH domain
MTKFGERIKKLRESYNLSQTDFASKFGLAQTTIGMYEVGKREPNLDRLSKFAEFFNVSVDYLIGNTDDPSKEYRPATRELLDMLHLSDDELFAKGPHTLDGRVLTKEEFLTLITVIRAKRQLDQSK